MKIDLTRFAEFATKPHGILICSILLSFAAWVLPGFGFIRKGFEHRDSLLSLGALVLFLLYAAMAMLAILSYSAGAKVSPGNAKINKMLSLNRIGPYYFLSVVALFGCAYFFLYLVKTVGASNIISFIGEGQANEIKKALYEDYSLGPLSLRYVVILTGGIALFRIISGISHSLFDFANILALLFTALASSRLSVVIAGILCVGLYVSHSNSIHLAVWQLVLSALVGFALLSIYNATRNSNFYAERGNENIFDAGLSEMVTYLGAPFQGSLSTAGHLDEISNGASADDIAGIELSLTTNSALSDLATSLGLLCIPVMVGTVLIAGFLMGFISPYRDSYLGLAYLVLLYGFSEFWRIYMFDKGIFITLLFFSLLIPGLILVAPSKYSE